MGVGRYIDKDVLKVRAFASTLLRHSEKIPPERQDDMIMVIMELTGIENVTQHVLEEISSLEYLIEDEDSKRFGEAILEKMGIRALVLLWRQHFLDILTPEFMPANWDVEREKR